MRSLVAVVGALFFKLSNCTTKTRYTFSSETHTRTPTPSLRWTPNSGRTSHARRLQDAAGLQLWRGVGLLSDAEYELGRPHGP